MKSAFTFLLVLLAAGCAAQKPPARPAEQVAPPPPGIDAGLWAEVDGLVARLGDDDYYVREAAQKGIAGLPGSALEALRESVERRSTDAEIKWRGEKAVADLEEKAIVEKGGVPSVEGTMWAGKDSDDAYYEFHFQPYGELHYKSPSGFYTTDHWKQDGYTIYMEMTNKYAEYKGLIKGDKMEGNAWNVTGKTWTWRVERQKK
jgi:hypothetical protein